MKGKKRYVVLALFATVALVWFWLSLPKSYTYEETKLPATFEAYYQQQLANSKSLNVRPGNEERWVKYSDAKTPLAFIYIHGFTASRAEGEEVVDWLADKYAANTYYLRLPGHGTNQFNHAETDFREYLDAATDALRMMQTQGEKVVVIGNSMGGLVATYLAANYPDLVDGLILASPFYDYTDPVAQALKVPGVLPLIITAEGPQRKFSRNERFQKLRAEGYENYWYAEQQYAALQSLEDLRNYAARSKYFKQVQAPTLLLAYYKDEQNQDGAASVAAMEQAFAQFASTTGGNPLNKLVKLPESDHVMLSRYIKVDKEPVKAELDSFVSQL